MENAFECSSAFRLQTKADIIGTHMYTLRYDTPTNITEHRTHFKKKNEATKYSAIDDSLRELGGTEVIAPLQFKM